MQRYTLTSADYVQNSTGEPDAVMDADDLSRLVKLAGIPGLAEGRDKQANAEYQNPAGKMSPMGSNISDTAMEKHRLEHEHHIKPGSPEWFQLWFSRPYLTGEKPVGKQAPTGNTLFSKPSSN
jgi:hypothetical protein